MALTAELYEAIVKIVDDRIREIRVTREDFNALQQAVFQLTEAQRRTEERLDHLAETVQALAEAQRRTEERLDHLAETVQALAEAQRRTEEAIRQLGRQVGALSDSIGFRLEDVAKVVSPSYLAKHLNISVPDLERRFFVVDKQEIEVNLYAEGWRGAESVIVLGKSKSRIYKADVERFLQSARLIEPSLRAPVVKVMFGFYIHPSASEVAKPAGVVLVASYQK